MLPVDQFSFKSAEKRTLHSRCGACCRQVARRHYQAHRPAYLSRNTRNNPLQGRRAAAFVLMFLREHPCVHCGEADAVVLEFNHVDPRSKSMNVADMVRRMCSPARLTAEMVKCEVVCANCHQRLTSLARPYQYKSGLGTRSEQRIFRLAADARTHLLVLEHLATRACCDCGQRLAGSGCSRERLNLEMAQCEVPCANCHRQRTAGAGKWFRNSASRVSFSGLAGSSSLAKGETDQ